MTTKAEAANKLFIENKILIRAGEIALDTLERLGRELEDEQNKSKLLENDITKKEFFKL